MRPTITRRSARLSSFAHSRYHNLMNIKDILDKIGATEAPLARQLLMTGLITRRLEEKGKPAPALIGGLALSYYTRDVYFTADIDLAYADREALDDVLQELGFTKAGRYWVHRGLDIAVEAPASGLPGEEAPRETVELEGGLSCIVRGLEDLIIGRMDGARLRASSVEIRLLRDRLGLGRFRKKAARNPEKRKLLLELALERIEKAERGNYMVLGARKRRFQSSAI